MTGATLIRAGDHFFYTDPRSGTLIVGVLEQQVSTGHDGSPPSRIPPRNANPAARERTFDPPPAGVPVLIPTGSHLWVG
ncbi:MAG TPA: hypothetical protein VFR59_08430 [Steroidobacteraceae bacterium]|nr:hypothetical protein [Steroidobacteraceae bacterium]